MRIKTEANSPKDFKYKWSTHQPVVNTFLELLEPDFILELGVGHFSTPLFYNSNAKKIIHVENDKVWLDQVKDKYDVPEKCEFRHMPLPDSITLKQGLNDIDDNLKKKITDYYTNLINDITGERRLMFTDGYTCTRLLSLNILSKEFDVVIYHDAEDPKTYDYHKLDSSLYEEYNNYILKTRTTHTGFLVKKNVIAGQDMIGLMNNYIDEYLKELGETREGIEVLQYKKVL